MAASKGKESPLKGGLKSVEPEPNAPRGQSSDSPKAEAKSEAKSEAKPKEVKTEAEETEAKEAGAETKATTEIPPKDSIAESDKLKSDKSEAKETSEAVSKLDISKETKPEISEKSEKSQGQEEAERPQRPPRPERRSSAFTSNLNELCAAFPEAAPGTCRGLLVAASNNLEAAFTGMLAISDETIRPASYIKEQIAHDERLARRLAMSEQRSRRDPHPQPRRREYNYSEEDPNTSDELYDGIQKGFNDTKQAVSSFWGNLKSKINGEIYDDEDDVYAAPAPRREPLRSQWFPREPSNPRPESGAAAPRLPSRKPSRPESFSGTGNANAPLNPASAPNSGSARRESRSVNAFGDETSKPGQKSEEPEPDAFFIGESDDELGSLNEDLEPETKISESSGEKSEKAEGTNSKSQEESDKASEEKRKEETKSAKEMLAKFKSDAASKAK